MKRLLITGSREWVDLDIIATALTRAREQLGFNTVLVHGDARGADRIAASIWCNRFDLRVEEWPADWHGPCRATCAPNHRRARPGVAEPKVCLAAGMYRNADMVAAGADLCLAFILDESRGATGCARMAHKAGIETRIFRAVSS